MRVRIVFALFAACAISFAIPAKAAKICAWMVESEQPDDERMLKIFLSSDTEIDLFYQIGGKGIVYEGNTGNSPGDGTFSLHAGQTDSPWSFGQTFEPPGQIDVNIEIHQMPEDVFNEKPKPLLANFIFRRNVPANEKKPPATLAKKQCAMVTAEHFR
jgi:hypothetical protein